MDPLDFGPHTDYGLDFQVGGDLYAERLITPLMCYVSTDVTIIEIEIAFLTENRIELKS